MTIKIQSSLYQQVILQHNKNPKNFGVLENPCYKIAGHNKMCGDHLQIFIRFENVENKDMHISGIAFEGEGCAILKASASMMTELFKGKTLKEVSDLVSDFRLILSNDLEYSEKLDQLNIFSGLSSFQSRLQCASLPWDIVSKELINV